MRLRAVVLLLLLFAPMLPANLVPVAVAQDATEPLPPLPRPRPDPDGAATTGDTSGLPPIPQPRPQSHGSAGASSGAAEAIEAATSTPQPVTLSARITADGEPIEEGAVWRIFDTKPDASGELALVAKSDDSIAALELPPGEYVVHLAYGRAQASETMSVVPGANEKSFVLEAGALRLNAAVTGDVAINPSLLTFDIETSGEEASRTTLAENLPANEIVTLNAGTYHVVSHFGSINAVVRADLRVEPGQLTDATLYHHASQVSFKLVSQEGGEAIADVDWTVKSADGTTLFTDLGAFPSTVLAEGDYLVLAKLGDQVYNRDFQVQAGSAREIEVLTSIY